MRRLAAVLSLLAALVVAAPPTASAEGGGNNLVQVQTTGSDRVQQRAGLGVTSVASNSVTSENVAFAHSRDCTDCRTVAVALQAVLITSDASDVRPANAAVAVNERCTRCATFAAAYQYVVATGGPVALSAQGQQEVNAIRAQAQSLAASGLDFPALAAELDTLAARFRGVIDEELRRVGRAGQGRLQRQVQAGAA
jgi:hypothetical protein